jgi:hypothetical protein
MQSWAVTKSLNSIAPEVMDWASLLLLLPSLNMDLLTQLTEVDEQGEDKTQAKNHSQEWKRQRHIFLRRRMDLPYSKARGNQTHTGVAG